MVVRTPQLELPEKAVGVPQLLAGEMLTVGVGPAVVIFRLMTADSVSTQEGVLSALRQRTR